jgi:environmental stress-induced protein Ves
VKLIRARDCLTTPWKNGGGSTTEVVAEPAGTSLDTFDWRISMASVAADGPFSEFPDIDRTLAVIKGSGLLLTIGNNATVTLDCGSDPISFPGDIATSARLIAGEITDLNVMTRRRRFSHRLLCMREAVSCNFEGNDMTVVVSLNGSTVLTTERGVATLDHGDAVIVERMHEARFRVAPAIGSTCYLVLLRKHHAQ